jgi:hypothetical protein
MSIFAVSNPQSGWATHWWCQRRQWSWQAAN